MSPSHTKEARKLARLKIMSDPIKLARKRAQQKATYRRHRDKILARNKAKYDADPEHFCALTRKFAAKNPEKIKAQKTVYRSKKRIELANRAREYYWKHHADCLRRNAERRESNRYRNRLIARAHSLLITDRYCREQLSKHSDKSAWMWTDAEVQAKREYIVQWRAKSIDSEKAAAIRLEFDANLSSSVKSIAMKFGCSPSNVYLILNNKAHHDPQYKIRRSYSALGSVTQVLQMINAAATLSEFAKEESNARS